VLPFLLYLGVPFLVAIGAVSAFGIGMDRRDRRRRARILEAIGLPDRAAVSVDGVLVSDAADAVPPGAEVPAVVSFHPHGTTYLEEPNAYAATRATPHLAIALDDGGKAVIEGDMQVVIGSRESDHRAPLDDAALHGDASLVTARVRVRTGQFRSLRVGDRVRARGVARTAPDDEAHYRGTSRVVTLSPEPSGSPGAPQTVSLASLVSPPRRGNPRGFLAGAVAVSLLVGGGARCVSFERAVPRFPATTASNPGKPAGPPACRAELLALLARNDFTGARAAGMGCDDPYTHAVVSYANGDFAAASARFAEAVAADASLPPSLDEAEAHLFAHEIGRAAETTRRMTAHFYPGPVTPEKQYLECIGGLLAPREVAPEPAPAGSRRGRSDRERPAPRRICASTTTMKYARDLDSEGRTGVNPDWMEYTEWMPRGYYAPSYEMVGNPFTASVGRRARLHARPVGVGKLLLDRFVPKDRASAAPGGRPPGHTDTTALHDASEGYGGLDVDDFVRITAFAAELTLFYGFAGFPERAAPYWPILDRVADRLEHRRSFHVIGTFGEISRKWDAALAEDEKLLLEHLMAVAAAAALHAGDDERAARYAARGEGHASHVVVQLARMLNGGPWEEPAEDGHWGDRREVFAAALTGSGGRLAEVLERQRSTGQDVLARVVPRITTERAALDRWFEVSFPSPCLTCGAANMLGHLADRRAAARALGRQADAAALAPAAGRFTDALTDPVVAFEVAELEIFFSRAR